MIGIVIGVIIAIITIILLIVAWIYKLWVEFLIILIILSITGFFFYGVISFIQKIKLNRLIKKYNQENDKGRKPEGIERSPVDRGVEKRDSTIDKPKRFPKLNRDDEGRGSISDKIDSELRKLELIESVKERINRDEPQSFERNSKQNWEDFG